MFFSYGPVLQLQLTSSSSSSRHFYPSLYFRLMQRVSTFKRSASEICVLFYKKTCSLTMTYLRSKHVALNDIYLVVLTVHVHNNATRKSLRRIYAVFRASRHGITSQKTSTSNSTAAGTSNFVFCVWKFLQPCVSVQYGTEDTRH
jgi:hypothetical protein